MHIDQVWYSLSKAKTTCRWSRLFSTGSILIDKTVDIKKNRGLKFIGVVGKLSKRKATQEEQYADQSTLDDSEEMRMKENKAFHDTEGDLLQAIDATENAVTITSWNV